MTLYKRTTIVFEAGRIDHVFYPVFRPIGTQRTSSRGCDESER